MRKKPIKYAISFGFCLSYAALHCAWQGVAYRTLSDGFAVPGLVCLFTGGFLWLSGQGAFNGAEYVLGNALRLLLFQPRKPYRHTPREKKTTGCGVLFVTGAVCLAAAGVFTGLFYG